MKTLRMKTTLAFLLLAAAIISLSGCAAKKAAWGSIEKGMIMKYQFKADRELNYNSTYNFNQQNPGICLYQRSSVFTQAWQKR